MEKISTLAIIDENWKEHLREMDDLKQSVQNAVYEQKDPLLIYKFEGFELFKRFIGKLNEDTSSFMMKLDLPVQDSSQVQAAAQRRQQQNYKESKEESASVLSGGQNKNRPPVEKQMPAKSEKIVGRNDRVTVQYQDGSVKKDVKFKTVEEDVKSNKCVLLDE
jgi:preprotein translocase subunit SecA